MTNRNYAGREGREPSVPKGYSSSEVKANSPRRSKIDFRWYHPFVMLGNRLFENTFINWDRSF